MPSNDLGDTARVQAEALVNATASARRLGADVRNALVDAVARDLGSESHSWTATPDTHVGMTRVHIEKMAAAIMENRYKAWFKCGIHDWLALPVTDDTGDHFCWLCGSLFSPTGAPLNEPEKPG